MPEINKLIDNKKKVYVYLKNDVIAKRFLLDAEAEGITFSDGVKPTQRQPDDLMALLPDGTLCYVGYIGRMYRHSPQCTCVDYELLSFKGNWR